MTVAAIAVAASAVVGAAGAARAGDASQKQGEFQAQVSRNNAIIAEQNADYAVRAGQAKAAQESMQGAAKIGRIRAAIGASGVDVNTGSAADVQESQAVQSSLDVETIMHNAQLEAYGYRTQGKSFEAQAILDKAAGDEAKSAGNIAALGTLIGGAGSAAATWTKGQAPAPAPAPPSQQ